MSVTADSEALVRRMLGQIAPDVDAEGVDLGSDIREDLDLDSMDFLSFVTALHEATGLEIPERDYPELLTLQSCAEYLDRHR